MTKQKKPIKPVSQDKPAAGIKNKKSGKPIKTSAGKSAASAIKPVSLNIRTYQVGFGDCFLLTFDYPQTMSAEDRRRHLLIDFGSTGMPDGSAPDQMMRVALDIEKHTGGKLHMVVATHRHKDHISGFTTQEDGGGTGDIIARLHPEVVIQPWTEDPDLSDSSIAMQDANNANDAKTATVANALHATSLLAMNAVSEAMLTEIKLLSDERRFTQPLGAGVSEQIRFLADDNKLPNKSAVENLRKMGKRNLFVSHGANLDLSELLPGIGISVLGPPTLDQHAAIRNERAADNDEFWMLRVAAAQNFWRQQAATSDRLEKFVNQKEELFPGAAVIGRVIPSQDRWFIRQLRAMRGEQMLGLVRILDKAMNNTSVILLLDVGGKKLLFPGDAQIENWEYALSIKDNLDRLKAVEVYKVGHHGSRNATPKTLWENFEHKSENSAAKNRLQTVVSTMEGKHGSRANHSEVPRETLVHALSTLSAYHTTQQAAEHGDLFEDIEITFS